MAKKTNPNAGKPGYDKYGVKLMSQRKKEKQAEKNRKQFIESRDARNKKIKDSAAQKAQVEKIKNTMGFSETSPSVPKSSKPKSKQKTKKDFGKGLKQFDTSSIKSDKKTLSTSKATAATLKDLGLKSKPKEEPKKQASNKERRQLNRAANLALRTGKTLDEASALKEKRRAARKQYLRNFASQLARGEQAAPAVGFGEGEEGKPTTGNSLVDASGIKEEARVKNEQAKQDEQSIRSSIDTFRTPNSGLGLGTTRMGDVGQNFGEGIIRDLRIDPDSTPYDFMKKEYNKKRG